ncbi:MAG: hypothetical protein AAF394_11030 [Planctomycetota bacterium]
MAGSERLCPKCSTRFLVPAPAKIQKESAPGDWEPPELFGAFALGSSNTPANSISPVYSLEIISVADAVLNHSDVAAESPSRSSESEVVIAEGALHEFRYLLLAAFGIGAFSFIVIAQSEVFFAPFIPYMLFAGMAALAMLFAKRKLSPRLLWVFGTLVFLGLIVLYARIDNYTKEWRKDDSRYVDYYNRWTGNCVYRVVTVYETIAAAEADEILETYQTSEGPLSSSGRPHGRWKHLLHSNHDVGRMPRLWDEYYWYGEEVTEGDWHLRNR